MSCVDGPAVATPDRTTRVLGALREFVGIELLEALHGDEVAEAVPLGFVEWPALASQYSRVIEDLTTLAIATPHDLFGDVDPLEIVLDLALIRDRALERARGARQ